ncbi:MAG: hypothetical protein QM784_35165 [Polyangiaceae bacterium]
MPQGGAGSKAPFSITDVDASLLPTVAYLIKQAEVTGLAELSPRQAQWPCAEMRCLVIEGRRSLMLAEVGLGAMDVAAPLRRLGAARALRLRNAKIRPLRTRLVDAGYCPDDVTDIFVSHLDAGLTGGLFDFPRARVHTWSPEHSDQAEALGKWLPRPAQLATPRTDVSRWYGFDARSVPFEDLECRLISLPGLGKGRCALALARDSGTIVFLGAAVRDVHDVIPGSLGRRVLDTLRSDAPFSRLLMEQNFERLLKDPRNRAEVSASFGSRSPLVGCGSPPLVLPDL